MLLSEHAAWARCRTGALSVGFRTLITWCGGEEYMTRPELAVTRNAHAGRIGGAPSGSRA